MRLRIRILLQALSAFVCTIPLDTVGMAMSAPATAAGPQIRGTREALAQLLSSNDPSTSALHALYSALGFGPIWSGNAEANARAAIARETLAHASDEGLDPNDYPCTRSAELPAAGSQAAQYDLQISSDLMRYVSDVRLGRVAPASVYSAIELPIQRFDAAQELAYAIRQGMLKQLLAGLPPAHPEYARLRVALKRYRAITAAGGWPSLPADTEIKLVGDARVSLLIQRLSVEDAVLATIPTPTRDDLEAAVRRYQTRNGLTADGRAGRATIATLNVPAAVRVAQIAANMERWRWMPPSFEQRYISVNVPDESLKLIENGKVTLTSRVIVGRKGTPTPIMRAQALAVTANPPWNVPHAIAVKEILPKLKRDPSYLAKENMVLVNGPPGDPHGLSIDWRRITPASFRYNIRQVPGSENALGALKLELPNEFNVYLHDTPAKSAFDRDDRALSHGCVRVQQILPLASLVLGGGVDAIQKLSDAIGSGATQRIPLRNPIPVYVLYWTVIADDDGTVEFRPDLYGRDTRLIQVLAGRSGLGKLAFYTGLCESPS